MPEYLIVDKRLLGAPFIVRAGRIISFKRLDISGFSKGGPEKIISPLLLINEVELPPNKRIKLLARVNKTHRK